MSIKCKQNKICTDWKYEQMIIKKKAKSTLTPVELDLGDALEFTLSSGVTVYLKLLKTGAEVISSTLPDFNSPSNGAKTLYRFHCTLEVNGETYQLEREIPSQKSFYEPWILDGVMIWFDAVSDIFKSDGGFLEEKDAELGIYCKPNKKARFALQDASLDICPGTLHPWISLPEEGLKIENCYRGEDCWMGPYDGMFAHGGLDINHAVGMPLWAPFDLDDQYYFNSLEQGDNNNRWRGIHRWEDGSEWVVQAHHMTELTVVEHKPLKKGEQFAKGAGVLSGVADHSHFLFKIVEDGKAYFLDPWILFWKMYKDKDRTQNTV